MEEQKIEKVEQKTMAKYKHQLKVAEWYTLPTRLLIDTEGNFHQVIRNSDFVRNNPDMFFRCAKPEEEKSYWAMSAKPININELNKEE